MGRIEQNIGNQPQNYNVNPDQNFANQPQNYNNVPRPLEQQVPPPPPSPYNAYSNMDEKPTQPYPPSPMNQPYQTQPPPQQTPTPVYPPANPHAPPQPVQFPPAPTDDDLKGANNSNPAQFPPEPAYGQQYEQFQQQHQQQPPKMNNHYAGQGNYYPDNNNIGMQQSPYHQATPQQAPPVASGIPIVATTYNESWSSELFDCMNDPQNALITLCFPCVTFGQIAEIIDNGQTQCATSGLIYGLVAGIIGMPCILSCSYRTKLRNKFGLMETPAPDWITHFLCEPCALCQAYRELEKRGLDPSIGWQGNVARQQQQAAMMAAPTYQTMNC